MIRAGYSPKNEAYSPLSIRIEDKNYGFKITHPKGDQTKITKVLDKLSKSKKIDGYLSAPTTKEVYTELSFEDISEIIVKNFPDYLVYKNMEHTPLNESYIHISTHDTGESKYKITKADPRYVYFKNTLGTEAPL